MPEPSPPGLGASGAVSVSSEVNRSRFAFSQGRHRRVWSFHQIIRAASAPGVWLRSDQRSQRLFELLFKYSRATFERSDLVFASGWPVWILIALIVAAAVAVGVTLARRRAGFAIPKLVVLGVLQTLLIAALLVLAWRPALVTQTLRPQENSVAVLLDTSGSMLYGDGTHSRLQEAVDALSAHALPDLKSTFTRELVLVRGRLDRAAIARAGARARARHAHRRRAVERAARRAVGRDRGRRARERRRRQFTGLRRRENRRDCELRRARAHGGRRRRIGPEGPRARRRPGRAGRPAGLDRERAGQHPA